MNNGKNKKQSISPSEMRQKLIYFQSEAAKYKFLSEKFELLLLQALQGKEDKIDSNETAVTKPIHDCFSYFNYSIVQDREESPFIYGSYTIVNNGNANLAFPIICLKVNDPASISIGGKIGELRNSGEKLVGAFEEWQYLYQDWRKKWIEEGELWLKPIHTKELKLGETTRFSGFDITFKGDVKTISVEGYCYFQQIPKGLKALNTISLKGI